ncbi:MAG: endonuclease [Candidatus Margulisiibacteriota bacterium]|nr:MAG: hypothetical protein A2X42_06220 [Candidatus Margulisbacteria bacterium GWF2_38_17]OGI09841.1 MAG: hypothetical protein A2X41_09940 [Candidatus Margulisbacteria bacterium GWE2_39_32]PZM78430.1 MAG: endonuclease [Candidatus Margulisiibacteriota bacterium]HCT84271.1 endonuclease [Candidatus Margulisiibacteriota bacterium]HCY36534.1 endonuclease [Candidatus Margulisiibacteriota bacterium]
MTDKQKTINLLLQKYTTTFAADVGIKIDNSPTELFKLFCSALLFSTRIRSDIAVKAAKELFAAGWTSPQKMIEASWQQRVEALDRAGYARYDESTSSKLEENSRKIINHYHGDLNQLREAAHHDPQQERQLLKQFNGIGDVGTDIFFREIQSIWEELFPFADQKAIQAAKELGLADNTQMLSELVERNNFIHLVDSLVKTNINKQYDSILKAA